MRYLFGLIYIAAALFGVHIDPAFPMAELLARCGLGATGLFLCLPAPRFTADAAAVGRLRVELGPSAWAELDLTPGWRSYAAPIHGRVEGGEALVVLKPLGHRRPGRFATERRELAVAVDWLGLDAREEDGLRGIWAAPFAAGQPGVLVAGSTLRWVEPGRRLRGAVRVLSGQAELRRAGRALWTGDTTACKEPCSLELDLAPGLLELRADQALLRLE